MIGYIGKYAPVEVLAGFSADAELIVPLPSDIQNARAETGGCRYADAVLSAALSRGYAAVMIAECCDPLRRIADILEEKAGNIYRLPVPLGAGEAGAAAYAGVVKKFIQRYVIEHQAAFDMEKFVAALAAKRKAEKERHIAFVGAAVPGWMVQRAQELSALPVVDYTCATGWRCFSDVHNRSDGKPVVEWYVQQLQRAVSADGKYGSGTRGGNEQSWHCRRDLLFNARLRGENRRVCRV